MAEGWGDYPYGVAQVCKNCGEMIYVNHNQWMHYVMRNMFKPKEQEFRRFCMGLVKGRVTVAEPHPVGLFVPEEEQTYEGA